MNLRAQDNYEQRLIDVEWEDNNSTKDYIAHIDIYGLNRAGLLNDVLQVLSNTAKMISTVNAQPTKRYEVCQYPHFFRDSKFVHVDNGCG